MLQNLSPEQLQQLKQLTPEQRAALTQQAAKTPVAPSQRAVEAPAQMQVRDTGTGRLESDMKQPPVDTKMSTIEVSSSSKPTVPVEQVSPNSIEKTAVRRAFEAFVRESKPLIVNTDHLLQFGYELFANQPSSFAPVTDVPVPPEYVLGPGDEIRVQMFGKDARDLALTVDREGAVAFPQIGPIQLAGLSFAQAKAMLAEQINQKMIGVSVSITMGQLRSIRIFALGDVYHPGSYTVSGLATLSHALFASGGVKKIGSLRNIELKRNGRRVATMDLYDFLLRGNTSKDVRLLPGDVVFVPTIGTTVAIAGEVVRPAIYELNDEKSVGDVLKLAGGLLPNAFTSKALIERFNPKGDKLVLNIDLSGNGLSTAVKNGDVIKVFTATDFETNQVLLIGNVKRPGKFAWHEGMKVLDLIQNRDDLLPESLMDYGIIESEAKDNREPEITRFKLGELMDKGAVAGDLNLALKPRDRVYVFQRAYFRQQPAVSIGGSVQTPGSYELKRNMRLADLVLAAGGVLRETDLGEIEIYRTDPHTHDLSVIKTNLAKAMSADADSDIQLQDLDRVVVHSIYESKEVEQVTVTGEVHTPGTVPLTQGMRVSDLIVAGNNITEKTYLRSAYITRYSVENGLKRISESFTIDLGAALHGDAAANVLLRPYDVLFVRQIYNSSDRDEVLVQGEVNSPGTYTMTQGMRVSNLINLANDVTTKAFLKSAEITRYKVKNGIRRESEHFEINLAAALKGDKTADIQLQPYDSLIIRRLSGWRDTQKVEILGEVVHPGIYPIEEGETLSSVLRRTGGYEKGAYLPAAVFTRESIREEQQKQLDELVRRLEGELNRKQQPIAQVRDATLQQHNMEGLSAAERILAELRKVKATGRLVIELSDIDKLKDTSFDIHLRDGDKLIIPNRPDEVLVLGEVYNQSALIYEPDKDKDGYLKDAGPTRMADLSASYIVRANGRIEVNSGNWFGESSMRPGDTIVVPINLTSFNLLDSVLDWSRATMQIGTSLATMKVLGVFP